jgi:hypothetical protein
VSQTDQPCHGPVSGFGADIWDGLAIGEHVEAVQRDALPRCKVSRDRLKQRRSIA